MPSPNPVPSSWNSKAKKADQVVRVRLQQIANTVVTSVIVGVSPVVDQRRCKDLYTGMYRKLRRGCNLHGYNGCKVTLSTVLWSVLVTLLLVDGLLFIKLITNERTFTRDHIRVMKRSVPDTLGRCAPGYQLSTRENQSTTGLVKFFKLVRNVGYRLLTGRSVHRCIQCPPGHYKSPPHRSCQPCQPGTFQAHRGREQCEACPIGTHQNSSGAVSCSQCPPGSSQPWSGQVRCVDCGAGTHQPQPGSAHCVPCGQLPCDASTGFHTTTTNRLPDEEERRGDESAGDRGGAGFLEGLFSSFDGIADFLTGTDGEGEEVDSVERQEEEGKEEEDEMMEVDRSNRVTTDLSSSPQEEIRKDAPQSKISSPSAPQETLESDSHPENESPVDMTPAASTTTKKTLVMTSETPAVTSENAEIPTVTSGNEKTPNEAPPIDEITGEREASQVNASLEELITAADQMSSDEESDGEEMGGNNPQPTLAPVSLPAVKDRGDDVTYRHDDDIPATYDDSVSNDVITQEPEESSPDLDQELLIGDVAVDDADPMMTEEEQIDEDEQIQEGTVDEGATDERIVNEGATDERIVDEGVTDERIIDEGAVVDEGATNERIIDEGVADEGIIDEGAVDDGAALDEERIEEEEVDKGQALHEAASEEVLTSSPEETAADTSDQQSAVTQSAPQQQPGITLLPESGHPILREIVRRINEENQSFVVRNQQSVAEDPEQEDLDEPTIAEEQDSLELQTSEVATEETEEKKEPATLGSREPQLESFQPLKERREEEEEITEEVPAMKDPGVVEESVPWCDDVTPEPVEERDSFPPSGREKISPSYRGCSDLLNVLFTGWDKWEMQRGRVTRHVTALSDHATRLLGSPLGLTRLPLCISLSFVLLCFYVIGLKSLLSWEAKSGIFTYLSLAGEASLLAAWTLIGETMTGEERIAVTGVLIAASSLSTTLFSVDQATKAGSAASLPRRIVAALVLVLCLLVGSVLFIDCTALEPLRRRSGGGTTDTTLPVLLLSHRALSLPVVLLRVDHDIKSSSQYEVIWGLDLLLEVIVPALVLILGCFQPLTLLHLSISLAVLVGARSLGLLLWELCVPRRPTQAEDQSKISSPDHVTTDHVTEDKGKLEFSNSQRISSADSRSPAFVPEKFDVYFDRGRIGTDIIVYINKTTAEEKISFASTSECKLYLAQMTGSSDSLQSVLAQLEQHQQQPQLPVLSDSSSSDDFVMIPEIVVETVPREESGVGCKTCVGGRTDTPRRRWRSAETAEVVPESRFGGEMEVGELIVGEELMETRRCQSSMAVRSPSSTTAQPRGSPCKKCRWTRL